MQIAHHGPSPAPAHRTHETETAVWVLIVVLFGCASFALVSLLVRIG